jgi:hypothetical protein
MARLRNPDNDKFKSNAVLKEQQRQAKCCKLEDCNNSLSMYEGPGSDILCREHQLECVEYGGMGKPERLHTFYRGWVCECCGYDPREDELRFGHIEDPYDKLRAMRGVMHGDHIELKSRGGSNAKENIRTLCVLCHMAKTYSEKDYLGTKNALQSN